ncbi:hypothetical protein GGX14DRAFT_626835 [Mycena pura]|uniref:Uncharacterized protein n=1 Tax=Mycena pura TaxID=153505 RepID=A0AAD6YQS6_9AGAR|nr:hypothetical protein GGX14DRAFT_656964 [Mycena pura]KAJ7226713.1 hypothetical protein GGX14DRAFT_626835 [Mycena pura]
MATIRFLHLVSSTFIMLPAREIPECYEEGPDSKVRCKVCTNAKWVTFQRGHVREHLGSAKHRKAVELLQVRQAGRADIEQRLGVVAAIEQNILPSGLTLAKLELPNLRPTVQEPCSEAENDMWQEYDKYEADFSAGNQVSDDEARRKVERDMDIMGIWDAVSLGQQLDGELDAAPNPAAEDDALLAEVLAALDASDPFNATEVQADTFKSAEWYPYPSKTMLLLDVCDNLPRLPVSESLMRIIIWILKQCGASDVPSLDALRKMQKTLRSQCGVPTISCTSIQGKNFCINDPRAIIRMECANPDIRSQLHLYPEVNTDGSVSEIWHGAKLCNELSPDLLTPMFDAGHGTHYYVNEIAQLVDSRFVIPVRWIKVDGAMHVDVHAVELNNENKADVKTDIFRVSAALLAFNLLDLEFNNRIPEWSDAAIANGYKDRMPNPLRSIAKGDPFYTIFIDYFSDDVSGNRSKSWNKHWNAYMTNRSLPRNLLQNEFYVHFVSTSQHASIPEQFKEFQKLIKTSEINPIRVPDPASSTGCSCYRLIVNADPSDNPMQAEICSCMGAAANLPCRKCKAGGTQVDKTTNEGYHAMFSCGELRSKSVILQTVQKQIKLACEGDEAELKKTYTASGIKDKYTEYWINDILSQFKKEVEKGASKDTVSVALKQWVKDNNDDIYSPFLTTDGFDPPRDTPIELLHTILLGVLKYVWHATHKSWTAEQKKTFELRLQAANISGLTIEGIRAAYIVQYANSLIGRQFKTLLQCTIFQLHDMTDENLFRAWMTVGELSALLWYPKIKDMELHCADLHVAIGNFLDSFAEIDPSKMITKVKTHLLTHAPSDIRMFGPLLGAITEAFESFNGVFRPCSILSNHRAPSRDIALQLAAQEGVKHRVAGGAWPLRGEGNEIIWTRCGPAARQLMQDQPILQRLFGWKKAEILTAGSLTLAPISAIKGQRGRPDRKTIILRSTKAGLAFNFRDYDLDSEWFKCKNLVAQSQELCDTNSWVVSSSPLDAEDTVMGKVVEILRRTDSLEGLVILEQYTVQPERHALFNMPVLTPKRREEASSIQDIQFAFNVQHDCSSGTCKPSGKRPVLQERLETRLEESFIEHDSLVNRFIINIASLHNPHLLRCVVPAALIKPMPIWDDRVLLHRQQAERLREGREARKAKNAAAAAARKALRPGTLKAPRVSKKTATGSKRTRTGDTGRPGKAKRQKRSHLPERPDELENDSSSDSDSDSDSDSASESEDKDDEERLVVEEDQQRPTVASRRPGLRVRVNVDYSAQL